MKKTLTLVTFFCAFLIFASLTTLNSCNSSEAKLKAYVDDQNPMLIPDLLPRKGELANLPGNGRKHRIKPLTHGEWPKGYIDHINRIKTDNRPCNLRDVSAQINRHNRGQDRRNTSGVTGVNWNKKLRKWHAQIASLALRSFIVASFLMSPTQRLRLAAEARFPLS